MSYLLDILNNDTLNKNIINNVINNINKIEYGFIVSKSDCDKLMCGIICSHCIDNKIIFNDEQLSNINNIINIISHE